MIRHRLIFMASILLGLNTALRAQTLTIHTQPCGLINTNAYLIADTESRQAALIDPGGAVDSLMALVEGEHFDLRYLLITHCHQDHVGGIEGVKARYPKAWFCYSQLEADDMPAYDHWEKIFGVQSVEKWTASPVMNQLMNFDFSTLPPVDQIVAEGDTLWLGQSPIAVLATPGHSRGSLTYVVPGALFSGDLILSHSVGALDCTLFSKEELIRSVRRLYKAYPDPTMIYPGHGQAMTVGEEKTQNRAVTLEAVNF